ncbi:MAG: STM4504/CBY_0614 family protein [Terracidiphilus sp.]
MEIYSQRKQAAEKPSRVYRFDLPVNFRNQVIHIWSEVLGCILNDPLDLDPASHFVLPIYSKINREICEAFGLSGLNGTNPCDELHRFFRETDTDQALSVIELTFAEIVNARRGDTSLMGLAPRMTAAEAVAKLNSRFQENAIGYRLERGRIIRIDLEFLHAEVVEPALHLMYERGYEGAFQEFLLAHNYYLQGSDHYGDCLTNCGKSLESTLKTICVQRNWAIDPKNTALKLINIVFDNKLIPDYLQSHFGALRQTLQCGVPTIRNKVGAHGAGDKPNDVPEYLVAYQIHLTASAIVFLIRANEAYGKMRK